MHRILIACLFVLVGTLPLVAAPVVAPTPEEALKVSRAAEGSTVGEHRLIDQDGKSLDLSSFRGQPLVISMIYTSCYHTCPVMSQTVAKAIANARKAVGDGRFRVLSIGFDTAHDGPERLRHFARQQGIDLDGWTFATADADTVDALSRQLGFTYYVSPRGFDHIAQTTILDAQGRIYRQVYGETFELPLLVEPLKDLVLGRVSSLGSWTGISNRIRIICTVYDPHSDAYRYDFGFFLEIGFGALSIATIAYLLFKIIRDNRNAIR
ncbi:MAG: SCO family protein [Magnetospirillum sp.]|nr:SCO family protein [Magnetospirillum sp.]